MGMTHEIVTQRSNTNMNRPAQLTRIALQFAVQLVELQEMRQTGEIAARRGTTYFQSRKRIFNAVMTAIGSLHIHFQQQPCEKLERDFPLSSESNLDGIAIGT